MFHLGILQDADLVIRQAEVPIYYTQDTEDDILESVFDPQFGTIYVRSGPYGTDLSLEQAFEFAVRLQALCVTQLDLQASCTIEG